MIPESPPLRLHCSHNETNVICPASKYRTIAASICLRAASSFEILIDPELYPPRQSGSESHSRCSLPACVTRTQFGPTAGLLADQSRVSRDLSSDARGRIDDPTALHNDLLKPAFRCKGNEKGRRAGWCAQDIVLNPSGYGMPYARSAWTMAAAK